MAFIDAERATPAAAGRSPQIDRLGDSIEINNQIFLEKASTRSRDWWAAKAERESFDWPAVMTLALDIVSSTMFETDFERACRLAEQQRKPPTPVKPKPRPTPQTTIEAILYCVRARGLKALEEPANVERLSRCDEAAKEQVNRRIAVMGGVR
jgi:hypothetical protein